MTDTHPSSDDALADTQSVAPPASVPSKLVFRHRLSTRLWHWSNVVAVMVLLMSGLMIFNAHPALYWGSYGANSDTPWLMIGSTATEGFVQLGESTRIPTTGVLGRWERPDGTIDTHAFPYWATLPGSYNLAMARRWHLTFSYLFAFGLLFYLIRSLWNGHIRRDLAFRRDELRPSAIWQDVKDHAQLKFHHAGEAALRFNFLQKLSYVGVIFVLIPLLIFTGLTMSPAINAGWPWLLDLFGGRQSARSIHFIAAAALAAFIVVHLLLVVLAGPYNEVRSMITGKFRVATEEPPTKEQPA